MTQHFFLDEMGDIISIYGIKIYRLLMLFGSSLAIFLLA